MSPGIIDFMAKMELVLFYLRFFKKLKNTLALTLISLCLH